MNVIVLLFMDVSSNKIGEGAIALIEFSNLSYINFRECALQLEPVCEALKNNNTITFIDLSYSEYHPALSAMLKHNNSIVTIILAHTWLKEEHFIQMGEALQVNQTLTSIDLTLNKMSEKSTAAIAEALKVNQVLTDVTFNNSKPNVTLICDALKATTSITSLDLTNCLSQPNDLVILSDAIKKKWLINILMH